MFLNGPVKVLTWTFMARLEDSSPSTISPSTVVHIALTTSPIKLGRTRAIFTWIMGKVFTISLCKAGRDLPKKTRSSHCCKRCFHRLLTEGAEYFCNQWILICTCFLQVFLTCNCFQLTITGVDMKLWEGGVRGDAERGNIKSRGADSKLPNWTNGDKDNGMSGKRFWWRWLVWERWCCRCRRRVDGPSA